jgi:hypothetical protein
MIHCALQKISEVETRLPISARADFTQFGHPVSAIGSHHQIAFGAVDGHPLDGGSTDAFRGMRLDAGRMIGLVFAEASREAVASANGSAHYSSRVARMTASPKGGDSGITLRETQELETRNLGRGQI